MIVVDKGRRDAESVAFDSRFLGRVTEGAVLLVVQQQNLTSDSDRQVCGTVVVIVTGGTSDSVQLWVQPCLPGYIFEFSTTKIVVQSHAAALAPFGEEYIDLAVSIEVQKTRTRPHP